MSFVLNNIENRRNCYLANFFRLELLRFDLEEEIVESKKEALASFLHEYTHYIQAIISIAGVKKITIYTDTFLEYRELIKKSKEIVLPISLPGDNPFTEELEKLEKIEGSKMDWPNACRVEFTVDDINSATATDTAVNLRVFTERSELTSEINKYYFGYLGIIEGMADLVQSYIKHDFVHNELRYHILNFVCKAYYPEILEDKFKLIVVCYCSLMCPNPGAYFFKILDEVKEKSHLSAMDFYSNFIRESKITLNGKETTFALILEDNLIYLYAQIKKLFEREANYYKTIFCHIIDEAKSGENLFLTKLSQEKLDKSDINNLFEFYGLPFIEAHNGGFFPISSEGRTYPEIVLYVGLEYLIKRLESKEEHRCPRYDYCDRIDKKKEELQKDNKDVKRIIGYDCQGTQWMKEEQCFMTEAIRCFGLKDKEIKILD